MAIASLPYYAGALLSRNLPNAMRFAPTAGLAMTSAQVPSPMQPAQPAPSSGQHLQMLKDFERVASLANQQRFRPMPTQIPMPTNPAGVPTMPQMGGAAYTGNEQRFRPMPAAPRGGAAPMQGPAVPGEFSVPGFAKGYANAAPGMSAQQYADQFAGGDLGKVKARQILVDGQLVNDFYTKGLLDGLLGGPAPMKPIEGTPANVPLPPQRPAEFGPSYQGGGLLSNIPFIGGLFGG